ncbi:MAG: MarR family transcriptional regulator [Bacteroidales bacterium]
MNTEDRIKHQKQLVERLGQEYEKDGMQPVAGRILALLMVMDKEEYTFDEIIEELQISKSSASVALKMLQLRNIVEYITHPGDRKRYFRIRTQEPFMLIDEFREKLQSNQDILKEIIKHKANKDSQNVRLFNNLVAMMDFFLDNFDKLKSEYLKKQ